MSARSAWASTTTICGRGSAGGCWPRLIDLADDWLGLTRLELDVMVDNEAAIALYERAGFVEEGVARAAVIREGVLVDTLWMARVKDAPMRSG